MIVYIPYIISSRLFTHIFIQQRKHSIKLNNLINDLHIFHVRSRGHTRLWLGRQVLQLIPQPWRGKARCWTPLAPLRRRLPRRGRRRQGCPDRRRRGAQKPQQPQQRVVIVGWFNANNDQWILWLAEGTNLESRIFACFWRFAFKWVLLWEASLLAAVGHVTFVDIDTGLRNPVRQCNCPQKLEGAFEGNLSKKRLRAEVDQSNGWRYMASNLLLGITTILAKECKRWLLPERGSKHYT